MINQAMLLIQLLHANEQLQTQQITQFYLPQTKQKVIINPTPQLKAKYLPTKANFDKHSKFNSRKNRSLKQPRAYKH